MRTEVTIDQVISFLNETLALDADAVSRLIEARVGCNGAVATHPTIQVVSQPDGTVVGILGILNGMFGVDEYGAGPIAAICEDDGRVVRFERTRLPT